MTTEEFLLHYEEFLQHHGVKGMKWGVRKARNAIKNKKADVKRRVKRRKNLLREREDISKLSTRQLQARTDRLRQENELKRWTKDTKTSVAFRDEAKKVYKQRDTLSADAFKKKYKKLAQQRLYTLELNAANKDVLELRDAIMDKVAEAVVTGGINLLTKKLT